MVMTTKSSEGLRGVLLSDHARLEQLVDRVAACVDANDPHGALAEWAPLERGLLAHLDGEEMFLFPPLSEEHEREVAELRAEHATFRAALGELGLALELHTGRKERFDDLVRRLREHAAREDELVYAWAESLPRSVFDAVVRRLGVGHKRAA